MKGLILEKDFTAWVDSRSRRDHRAYCDCGYTGHKRWMHGSAVMDVSNHCVKTGHHPAING